MTKHNFRLLSSGFWVDVRLRQIRGRWIASADTPDWSFGRRLVVPAKCRAGGIAALPWQGRRASGDGAGGAALAVGATGPPGRISAEWLRAGAKHEAAGILTHRSDRRDQSGG